MTALMKTKGNSKLKAAQKELQRLYGKRCSEYSPLCCVCAAWMTIDLLDWHIAMGKSDSIGVCWMHNKKT